MMATVATVPISWLYSSFGLEPSLHKVYRNGKTSMSPSKLNYLILEKRVLGNITDLNI